MRSYDKIASALGFGPGSEFNLDDLCDRSTLYRRLVQLMYTRGGFSADDLDEARQGLSNTAVGNALVSLSDEASKGISTWPASPPDESL